MSTGWQDGGGCEGRDATETNALEGRAVGRLILHGMCLTIFILTELAGW